ncbi:uncharacterized protein [Macrobrachium rosenbergii]|uniref:uncharacterized protein n=1 Tax=Macrobrachium rosenbergii TaxID=79674 RepID=UPI0034D3FE5C
MADAEHLVSDRESDLGSVGEGSVEVDSDNVSVAVGLTLFEDPPRIGTLYEGPANFPKVSLKSFVEFARIKEEQFDDWLKSRQVVTFAALRELLLLEEFKKACSRELRVYLEEVKATKVVGIWVESKESLLPLEFLLIGVTLIRVLPGLIIMETEVQVIEELATGATNQGISKANAILVDVTWNVKFLRDTGSARSLILKTTLNGGTKYTGNFVVLGGFPDSVVSAPLVNVHLSFPGYDRITELAVVDSLPIPGIDGILGNDMLDSEGRELFPILSVNASPVTVTTRSAARAANLLDEDNDDDLMLSSVKLDVERPGSVESSVSDVVRPFNFDCDRAAFIKAQKDEFNFDLGDVEDLTKPRFGIVRGLLYRFSRPATDDVNKTGRVEQIIVPSQFRKSVLELAHTNFFSGHLGMLKTFHSLARYFWWPGMKLSVKQFIRECETCQVMGKPNQGIPKAPLHPIPAIGEPFSELVIDVVGPLPKTKTGYVYLLTIMDRASRFPEAIPMRRITSKFVFEKLMDFFSRYGLPRVIQTDCGTNFTSKVFRGKCAELAIQHITSVPYHPESQGLVERFHQTLKSVLKKHCYDSGSEWDKALPFALFAIRNHPNSSTGVAPFELVKVRSFEPGELVLVLSMDPDSFLEPRYKGPWKVLRKLSDVNYEIEAPGSSRKCRIFHINRLKPYVGKCGDPLAIVYEPVSVVVDVPPEESDDLVCQVPSDALGKICKI